MPFRSQTQSRLFRAKANSRPGKSRKIDGPSVAVAKKYIADSKGQDIAALPDRVKR